MRKNTRWTKEEDEILLNKYGKCSMETLSKSLNRTPRAIRCRLVKIEGTHSITAISGNMTTKDVSEIMGVVITTVHGFILNKNLPHVIPNRKYLIQEESFWKWLKNNLDSVNFINIDDSIESIVPDWYRNEIKMQKQKLSKQTLGKTIRWTSFEETMAWNLFIKGYSNRQIAKEVNRSEVSVKSKLKRMTRKKMKKAS